MISPVLGALSLEHSGGTAAQVVLPEYSVQHRTAEPAFQKLVLVRDENGDYQTGIVGLRICKIVNSDGKTFSAVEIGASDRPTESDGFLLAMRDKFEGLAISPLPERTIAYVDASTFSDAPNFSVTDDRLIEMVAARIAVIDVTHAPFIRGYKIDVGGTSLLINSDLVDGSMSGTPSAVSAYHEASEGRKVNAQEAYLCGPVAAALDQKLLLRVAPPQREEFASWAALVRVASQDRDLATSLKIVEETIGNSYLKALTHSLRICVEQGGSLVGAFYPFVVVGRENPLVLEAARVFCDHPDGSALQASAIDLARRWMRPELVKAFRDFLDFLGDSTLKAQYPDKFLNVVLSFVARDAYGDGTGDHSSPNSVHKLFSGLATKLEEPQMTLSKAMAEQGFPAGIVSVVAMDEKMYEEKDGPRFDNLHFLIDSLAR